MSRRLAPHPLAVLGALLFLAGCRSPAPPPASLHFDNGLTVLLRPVKGAPDVAVVVLFSVGGDADPPGKSGLAHALEHLYVTAAAGAAPARTADELMRSHPRGWNAQTGDRYTVIASVSSADRLGAELADAAARMGALRIADADLFREKPRLAQELSNMFGGMPALAASNQARERVRGTPYGGRKGGRPEVVAALGTGELGERWRRFYKPKNAILAVAGGFDAAAARAEVERLFGSLPAGDPAPTSAEPVAAIDPAPLRISAPPGLAGEACLAFRAPPPASPDHAAFLAALGKLLAAAPALGAGPFPVRFAPLDDPHAAFVCAPAAAGENTEAAVARLDAFVAAALKAADGRDAARASFGAFLGLLDVPDAAFAQNLYGLAFGAGRREQLGLDGAALRRAFDAATPAEQARVGEAIFGRAHRAAVVVSP